MILQRFDMENRLPHQSLRAPNSSKPLTATKSLMPNHIKPWSEARCTQCYAPDQISPSQSPKYLNLMPHQPLHMKPSPKGFYDTSKDQWTSGSNTVAKKDWL